MKTARPLLACFISILVGNHAHAEANLSFSGGGNSALTITLNAPVTYQVTATDANAPLFVFEGFNFTNTASFGVQGDLTYSINGGANQPLMYFIPSDPHGVDAGSDLVLAGNYSEGVTMGDTITLNAGSLTTNQTSFGETTPPTGRHATFITDVQRTVEAGDVPEPSIYAMMLGGLGLLGFGVRRKMA